MTPSFLILFITIKTEIGLILQGVSINTHSIIRKGGPKKKILYTSLILSYHHSHTNLLFYLSLKKNILKEVEERRKFSVHSLFLSQQKKRGTRKFKRYVSVNLFHLFIPKFSLYFVLILYVFFSRLILGLFFIYLILKIITKNSFPHFFNVFPTPIFNFFYFRKYKKIYKKNKIKKCFLCLIFSVCLTTRVA